jgi:hypothetical protein
MRRALRLLAAVVIGGSVIVAPVYVVGVTQFLPDTPLRGARVLPELVAYVVIPVLLLGLVACVAGILLCVTELTLPLPTPPPAGRRAGLGLRVLAAVQLAGGIATAVLTSGVAAWELLIRPSAAAGVVDLVGFHVGTFGALGLSCLGGLLWCAVRVAYARPAQGQVSPEIITPKRVASE